MRFISRLFGSVSHWLRPQPRRMAPARMPAPDLARTPLEDRLLSNLD